MNRFMPERGTCMSKILRRANFWFRSLRVSRPVSGMLPFKPLKTHSLIQFTCFLSQFDTMALRSFGWADMSTWGAWYFDFIVFIVHVSAYILGGISDGKMQVRNIRRSSLSCDTSNRYFTVFQSHPNTSGTDRHCLRVIPNAPVGGIDSYHAHFSIPLYILRSARYCDSRAADERGSG